MALSESQLHAICLTERICSGISVLGTALIIGTFLYDKSFRKPINRLVFYASWGNIMANVGTMISRGGIYTGVDSPLCQFQGFLIQMFLPADALWMLCLAFNVYLSFFRKYDAERLRSLELKYLIFCYGTPFVPAFVYFFINIAPRGKVYGSATLWCWVSLEWDYLRIAVFYGPVWLIITITFAIYIYIGAEIFRKRRELRAFAHTPQVLQNPLIGPYTMSKMTEVEVKSEVVASLRGSMLVSGGKDQIPHSSCWTKANRDSFGNTVSIESATAVPVNGMAYRPPSRPNQLHSQHTAVSEAHDAAWSYCRCAILFFIALLVTWVPSTANRVNSLVHPDSVSFSLNYVSALVLPLQGFWNCCVYITISRPAFQTLVRRLKPESWRNYPARDNASEITMPERKTSTRQRTVSEYSGTESDRTLAKDGG